MNPGRVNVPAGFSGWWCERCERPVAGIPEDAGSPAKCSHCHKWTVVWIPPASAALVPEGCRKNGNDWERTQPTDERKTKLFAHMHEHVENRELPADLAEHERQQTNR